MESALLGRYWSVLREKPTTGRARGLLRIYGQDLVRLQRILDPLLAGSLFWLFVTRTRTPAPTNGPLLPAVVIVTLLTAWYFNKFKVYTSHRQKSLWTLLSRISEGWFYVIASLLITAFAAKVTDSFSRIDFALWSGLCWLLIASMHVGSQKSLRFLRTHGGNSRTVIYWGNQSTAVEFFEQLKNLPYIGLRLKAWFSPETNPSHFDRPHDMPPCAGGLKELEKWLQYEQFDQIAFTSTSDAGVSTEQLISLFGNTCKPTYYIPAWANDIMNLNVEQMGRKYLIGIWGSKKSSVEIIVKRIFDILAAMMLIVLLSPLLLLLGLLVALSSPGPIIYRQDRYGLDGLRFKIYKYRTMSVTEPGDQIVLRQASKSDPRVTPIGRFMRQWSLDELPQLFNVLNGSMSIVGPRPHAVSHNEYYRKKITGYMQRHGFRPGITGRAQIEGFRGETPKLQNMVDRVEADLHYLNEWSIGLDLKILVKTLMSLRSRNAY